MRSLVSQAKALVASRDRGATAAEYALIIVAVVAVVATIVFALGGVIKEQFKDTCDKVKTTTIAASCTDTAQ